MQLSRAATVETETSPRRFLAAILPLDRRTIGLDILAGVTLAAIAIPEVMGYTSIARMPVVTGLYTILIPLFVFAVLESTGAVVRAFRNQRDLPDGSATP